MVLIFYEDKIFIFKNLKMKQSRIIVLVSFITLLFAGCTNTQDKQLQQQNYLLQQQNTLLQQQINQEDNNTNIPSSTTTTDNVTPTDTTTPIDNTKTIPFDAVYPANHPANEADTTKGFAN